MAFMARTNVNAIRRGAIDFVPEMLSDFTFSHARFRTWRRRGGTPASFNGLLLGSVGALGARFFGKSPLFRLLFRWR